MAACTLDHITVTAPTLESGAAFVQQVLGVRPQPGGQHVRMGTHNLLLRLGEGLFLEVIALDPGLPPPGRPRWFELDTLDAASPPALSTWVARTSDIHAAAAASTEPLGIVEPMSRGALNWLITIPPDGALPLNGAGPALIQWQAEPHPASRLEDHGLSLVKLELRHPDPDRVTRLLQSLHLDGPVVVAGPSSGAQPLLVAHIDTPRGQRQLSVPG